MNFPDTFPNLDSERLVLRAITSTDKIAIFKLRTNKAINVFIQRDTPKNLNEADGFIQTCLEEFEKKRRIFWGIRLKESYELIGSIVFHQINSNQRYAEIGYEIHPDYQQDGYMSEALNTVLDYGKHILKLKTIEAFTHQNNVASIALLKRYGFSLSETKEDPIIAENRVFVLDLNETI